jgi:putative membrane protein
MPGALGDSMHEEHDQGGDAAPLGIPSLAAPAPQRVLFGGFLMGLANLVPGVSGGTMILALGLYDRFIGAIADITRLRREPRSIWFLALIGIGAVASVALLAGVAVDLVVNHRWVMYSLFVGMTLGGVPELWKQCRPLGASTVIGTLVGIGIMAGLAWGLSSTQLPRNTGVFLIVGAIAASSMILPGVSGSYLLLILGMYEVVVGSISETLRGDRLEGLAVMVPVGIGAVLGMALLSNVLKLALARAPKSSHAVLLGLLCGSVLGLWPFQEAQHPELTDRSTRKAVIMLVEGQDLATVNEAVSMHLDEERAAELRERYGALSADELKAQSVALVRFDPSGRQWGFALLLLLAGGITTRFLGRGSKTH